MESKVYPREIFLLVSIILFCFIGGVVNGLVGTGSGIMFMLCATLLNRYTEHGCDMYSLSMSCVLPVSVVSLLLYPSGSLDVNFCISMLPWAVIGGIVGALIKGKIKTHWLSFAFAALTIYSGISMILRA
ncbi:MAG: TSUP family transporter [Eubacteriales bacterium]